MKQEFITSRGKVTIEKDILFVKTLNADSYTFFFRIVFPLLAVGMFFLLLSDIEYNPRDYFRLLVWGIFSIVQLPTLYDSLIKRSYAARIPLHKIISLEIQPDNVGLETFVILKLNSGRYRKIVFRTLEHQFDPFVDIINSRLSRSQLSSN